MRRPSSLIATAAAMTGLAAMADMAGLTDMARAAPIGAFTTKGAWSFVSEPGLHPPKLLTDAPTVSSKLAAGDFLVTNTPSVSVPGPMTGQSGSLILDSKLQPVWFAPVPRNLLAADLQQESYNGKPVLVWWEGVFTHTGVTTKGQVVVVDQRYHKLAQVKARAPWVISLHDAQISGTHIWVTVYRNVAGQNLTAYHGAARGSVLDAGVQEYDLNTGKLLYTWDALKHIPLSESRQPAPSPSSHEAWDAYHLNTVDPRGDQFLVSLRNTWAAYLVTVKNGRVVWVLGGRHSSFKGPASTRFAWQHDVQLAGNQVTMFNDNCCGIQANGRLGPNSGPSSGLILRLNTAAHKVTLVKAFVHHPTRDTAFLGSMQLIPPSGNALVGYGSLPYFSEYDRSGRLLLDAVFPHKDQTYRARFSSTWVGVPSSPPSGAARRARGKTTVYASWNGATQVAAWRLLGGQDAAHLAPVATKPRRGFETGFAVPGSARVFQLIPVDAQGHSLGTSAAFTAR